MPATISAGALAAGAYWLAHSSLDWFWTYPVVTAPVFALLGRGRGAGAVDAVRRAPAGRRPNRRRGGRARRSRCATVPFYLSERYVNDAYRGWQTDLQGAYDDLDRAESLDPFSDEPPLAEGSIAREAGDRARAVKAFREAIDRTPEAWVSHFYLGELLEQEGDTEAAQREFETASGLNPRSQAVQQALGQPTRRRALDRPVGRRRAVDRERLGARGAAVSRTRGAAEHVDPVAEGRGRVSVARHRQVREPSPPRSAPGRRPTSPGVTHPSRSSPPPTTTTLPRDRLDALAADSQRQRGELLPLAAVAGSKRSTVSSEKSPGVLPPTA